MRSNAWIVVAGSLVASSVRADMLAPGEKGVNLTVQVDVTGLPADKALIIDHTFRGADVVVPGSVRELEWHPLGGDMQVKLLARSEADKLEPFRKDLDRPMVVRIMTKAVSCGLTFPGVRTIPDSSPAEEVRLVLRASVTGDACTAEFVRTDYFDKDGKPVVLDGKSDIPPPRPPAPAAPPAPASEPAPAAPPAPAPAPTDERGCATTDVPPAGLGALVLGLLLRRRRR